MNNKIKMNLNVFNICFIYLFHGKQKTKRKRAVKLIFMLNLIHIQHANEEIGLSALLVLLIVFLIPSLWFLQLN